MAKYDCVKRVRMLKDRSAILKLEENARREILTLEKMLKKLRDREASEELMNELESILKDWCLKHVFEDAEDYESWKIEGTIPELSFFYITHGFGERMLTNVEIYRRAQLIKWGWESEDY